MARGVRRLLRSTSGNFATLGALLLPAALVLAAVAVDEGSLYVERRELQSLTDLAAIAAAADIGDAGQAATTLFAFNGMGRLRQAPAGAPLPGDAEAFTVAVGRYTADPKLAAGQRFVVDAAPYNAVRVTARTIGTRYFAGSLVAAPAIGASAIASAANEAAFSIGSRLASLDEGIVNALLGGLFGTNLSLSLMDYEALAKADVETLDFLQALAGEAHLEAASYEEVLESEVTVGQFVSALAAVTGNAEAKAALKTIAAKAQLAPSARIPLSHAFGLGSFGRLALGDHPAGLSARADALAMLTAGAALAGGDRQLALNLGLALPNLASVNIDLAIGEPPQHSPWFSIGERGQIVRTAQTRLSLTAEVAGALGILGASVRLPVYLELAFAEARLDDVSCPTGRKESLEVAIAARPGVAEAWIGEVDAAGMRNFSHSPAVAPAKIAKVPLVTVTGTAHAAISNPSPTILRFSAAEIAAGKVKKVSTHGLAGSLSKSLLSDLALDVKVAGIDLGLSELTRSTVSTALAGATSSIDDILDNLLAVLGVKVGEADIRVSGGNCGRAVLVQ